MRMGFLLFNLEKRLSYALFPLQNESVRRNLVCSFSKSPRCTFWVLKLFHPHRASSPPRHNGFLTGFSYFWIFTRNIYSWNLVYRFSQSLGRDFWVFGFFIPSHSLVTPKNDVLGAFAYFFSLNPRLSPFQIELKH